MRGSYFYTRREIGFRVALWVSSALSAGAFAGAIACASAPCTVRLTNADAVQIREYALARWRVLFLSGAVVAREHSADIAQKASRRSRWASVRRSSHTTDLTLAQSSSSACPPARRSAASSTTRSAP